MRATGALASAASLAAAAVLAGLLLVAQRSRSGPQVCHARVLFCVMLLFN